MPLVSVIVPVYKAEDLLRRCTDSVLGQTMVDLEMILIDDGSPDGSGALCDDIAAEDGRVRVVHKPNGGVSSARNAGLDAAAGKYIAFADADDWYSPDMLEKLVAAARSANADSAGCAHMSITENGERTPEPPLLPAGTYDAEDIRRGLVGPLIGDRLGESGRILNGFIWRFLYSADIIAENGIRFEGAYLEDELFLAEYFMYSERLAVIDEPLYHYFWNTASATHKYMRDYPEVFRRFMERKEALVERFGIDWPRWRESSEWAGLLIAISNEFAPGNPASREEKKEHVKAYAGEYSHAVRSMHPKGLPRNKQIVVELVRKKAWGLLARLYSIKNRN